jgi:putative aminopeptidase FrvX
MIISRKKIAREKIEKLKQGYSVYSETEEIIQYIEKEIKELGLKVHIDRTPIGCWFIPEEKNQAEAK